MIDVVPVLTAEWAAIDELVAPLSAEQWAAPTALPGWSVQDNVTHIIGTECALAGRKPPPCDADVREFSHVRNDLAAMNEVWIEGMRAESPTRVLERYREITELRRKHLEAMTDAEFDAPAWTPAGKRSYRRFMRMRIFDCWMHEQDIREAVGIPGNDDGPCAVAALSEVVDALGFLVGKRAGAPDGSTVTLELTGPVPATHHVLVDGRARLVESLPEPATVTVRLPSPLFARLVGGRTPVAERLPEIEVTGDVELGHRIVHALPYTI